MTKSVSPPSIGA
jgi:hypothetical protein